MTNRYLLFRTTRTSNCYDVYDALTGKLVKRGLQLDVARQEAARLEARRNAAKRPSPRIDETAHFRCEG